MKSMAYASSMMSRNPLILNNFLTLKLVKTERKHLILPLDFVFKINHLAWALDGAPNTLYNS
jgi:hypothetical protein